MKYYIVDAFTDQPFGGNPAGVVLLDGNSFPNERLMLQIAAELRYSETAFVRRDSEKEFTIRYFTPMAEVDLCGHATIASFALLHRKLGVTGRCLCYAKAGDIYVEAGPRVLMQMTPSEVLKTIEDTEEVYRALGIFDYTPALPVMIVSTGLPDFMIQVGDVETLNHLPLDMNAISAVTEKHNAVSFHVFAFGNDGHTAHVRDFGPLYGIPEESATGTANTRFLYYINEIRSAVLVMHGEKAHSRYFGEAAYKYMVEGQSEGYNFIGKPNPNPENKQLLIIPSASHCDLYDGGDGNYIPWDALADFFGKNL